MTALVIAAAIVALWALAVAYDAQRSARETQERLDALIVDEQPPVDPFGKDGIGP